MSAFPSTAAPSSVPPASEVRHLPIICLTSKASPDDLRSYMAAGMNGCVSKPAEPGPLLNTLRAAVPLHLSPVSPVDGRPLEVENDPGRVGGGVKVVQGKGMGVLKGSAACAAEGMALATRHEDSVEGALQVNASRFVVLTANASVPRKGSRCRNVRLCCSFSFDSASRKLKLFKRQLFLVMKLDAHLASIATVTTFPTAAVASTPIAAASGLSWPP